MAKITIEVDDNPVDAEIGDTIILFKPVSAVDAEWLVERSDAIQQILREVEAETEVDSMDVQRRAIRQTREFLAELALDEDNAKICRQMTFAPVVLNALVDGVVEEYSGRPMGRSSDSSRRPRQTRQAGGSGRGR